MPRKTDRFDPARVPGYAEDFKVRKDLVLGLRRLREDLDISQVEAAQKATFTNGTWSSLEVMRNATTKLEYLQAAYRALGKRLVITVEDWQPEGSVPEADLREEYGSA